LPLKPEFIDTATAPNITEVMASFEIEITEQHWLGEPHEQSHDGCSHGGVRASIAGTVVTSDDLDYGISQSALSLLWTLEHDHNRFEPMGRGYLLCHGCGYPDVFGCGTFGTDWSVRHEGEIVVLSEPTRIDASETTFDIQARVSVVDYTLQVVAFAETARAFYIAAGPRQIAPVEQEFHDQFWAEFDDRLGRATAGQPR
jgi:hypothetical protein